MKATLLSRTFRYKSGKMKGQKGFVFSVSGTEDELANYQLAQGEFYRTDNDTGSPLYFSSEIHSCRRVGDKIDLIITEEGGVFVEDIASDIANAIADADYERKLRIKMKIKAETLLASLQTQITNAPAFGASNADVTVDEDGIPSNVEE